MSSGYFSIGFEKIKRGFSLLELVITLSVLTVALVPITGLIMVGLKNTQTSEEETLARNLLTAVIQDMRYTPSSQNKSLIFKLDHLPYSTPVENQEYQVWIDLTHHLYQVKPKNDVFCFELKWVYSRVPESKSLAPVEAFFTVRWPPPLKSSSKTVFQEVTSTFAFDSRG